MALQPREFRLLEELAVAKGDVVSRRMLPKVDLDSKKVVVGTTQKTVDVPKVTTKKEEIAVPAIGVTDGKKD